MRRAFADTLLTLFNNNDNYILLTGDLGFGVFDQLQAQHPDRFINVGICEQAMVDIAAGLANEGYRPIVYSIASFMTGRAWEQIKLLSYQNLPVVIVGAGGGYTYAKAGNTHQAAEDLGLMAMVPGMTVTAPGCPQEIRELLPQLLELPGSSYMRIGKYGEVDYDSSSVIKPGKARCLRAGTGATIATTGDMAERVLGVIGPEIWQFHTIKPLDTGILSTLPEPLIVVEECSPLNGLYAAILATGLKKDVVRIGPPDEVFMECWERGRALESWGMGVEDIQKTVWELATNG